jgi:transposase
MAVRAGETLVLSTGERERLAEWAAEGGRLAVRAAIVLACAEGQPDTRVAAQAKVSRATVAKWRSRFAAARLAGLRDMPRPGTPRKITDAQVREVLARTRDEPPPAGRDHWTTRAMAAVTGLSQSAVSRIWRSAGVDPASWMTGGTGDNEGVSMEHGGIRQSGQPRQATTAGRAAAGAEPE